MENYIDRGYEVTTEHDDASWMYDDLWHGVSFISNHNNYKSMGEMSHIRVESLLDGDIPEGYEAVKVYAYIHGSIALSVKPFSCPWDSGLMGYLLFKTGEFGNNNIGLEGFVKSWNAIINGEVYYFTIQDENGEVLDSCGGFDDYDYMKKEIDSIINGMVEYDRKQRVEKLKAMIKHRAPLEKRAG